MFLLALFAGRFFALEIPKFKYIFILGIGDENMCDEADNELIEDKTEFRKLCSSNPEIY